MIEVKDQMNNVIRLESHPRRIVSIVPSQTELLFDLGLSEEVVGITNFCIHPRELFLSKTRIGGTKQLNFEKIDALQPDLIIANKEENQKEQVELLQEKYPVWISDINTLEDAYEMMQSVGQLVNRTDKANQLTNFIQSEFQSLSRCEESSKSVAYFIWRKPWMVAAKDTFIHHILERIGFTNTFETSSRYPETDLETLKKLSPDYVFLSSEPYPFKQRHIEEIQSYVPNSKIVLVDGEMFSWYGSRLQHAPNYFQSLFENL